MHITKQGSYGNALEMKVQVKENDKNLIHKILAQLELYEWILRGEGGQGVQTLESHHKLFCVSIEILKLTNGIARTLKKLHTSKGDYWIKQWFSSIAYLFIMGTSLKEKNLLPEGANAYL